MKRILRFLKWTFLGVYAVCAVMLVVFLLPQTGFKALTVVTGSMTPAIPKNSLVVIHRPNLQSLKVGQVITYVSPTDTRQTITHRIIAVKTEFGVPAFITKGDANKLPDPEVIGGRVVGRVVLHVPAMGGVLDWIRSPIGLGLFVILPGILIIFDETRRLVRAFKSAEKEEKSHEPAAVITSVKTPVLVPAAVIARPAVSTAERRPKSKTVRSMDFIAKMIILVLLPVLMIIAHASADLMTQVTLTGNTIATVPAANHVLINKVFLGSAGGNGCDGNNSVNVSTTGPNSSTNVNTTETCTITSTGSTNINLSNTTDQTAQSGPATVSNSGGGGDAVSGDASNTSNTNFNVTVGGSGTSSTSNSTTQTEWVELSNPTSRAVSIQNWSLTDSAGTLATLSGSFTVPANGTLKIDATLLGNAFANSLNPGGDKVLLKNNSGTTIDAVNWGTDHDQFNPPVVALSANETLKRKFAWLDTDTAGDWTIQP